MARKTVRVTCKQVDVARAEVEAFRAIGRTPDPVVVRIAAAGTSEPEASAARSKVAAG